MHFVRVDSSPEASSPRSFPLCIYPYQDFMYNPILFSTKYSFIQMLSNKTRRMLCGVPSDQRTNSSSLAAVVSANDDLLLEILLHLPVRSLLVFKSVSKRWLSLISDPYFVNNHCLRTCTPTIPALFYRKLSLRNPEFKFIFLDGKVTSVPFKFLNFLNDPGNIIIEQSCNGLLCCSSSDRANASSRTYYVYNPSTKQYTTLPRSQNRETTTEEEVDALFEPPQSRKDCLVSVCCISLAFDPLKSPHYKAIGVLHLGKNVFRIEIYSSETASWKLSGDAFPAGCYASFWKSGVFWNGSVHWMSFRSDSDPLYFDIDQELLKTMLMPSRPDDEDLKIMYFGEFKGHLHLIEGRENQTTRFDILEMETDYSAWNVKYRVDLDTLITACPEMMMFNDEVDDTFEFSILLVVDEEEKELSSLVMRIPAKVISYNLKERTFKIIHDLSSGVQYAEPHNWANVDLYIESLACV